MVRYYNVPLKKKTTNVCNHTLEKNPVEIEVTCKFKDFNDYFKNSGTFQGSPTTGSEIQGIFKNFRD